MKMYKSKAGEVGTLQHWQDELRKFWKVVHMDDARNKKDYPIPENTWNRYVAIIGLEEVENENVNYVVF